MAAQQVQFAETIRAMKLALKRRADDSDSDTSIHAHTNRGNKLKRHAKHVRSGRLDDSGRLAHRRKVNHAGYTRHIIASNPPLYDADGDVVSPNESENEHVAGEPMEEDAFGGGVRLEQLLRPLTRASDLPEHPGLSAAYKSPALTQMAEEALEMVRREKEVLWKAKRLLRRFRGDADWVPCEVFETEQDEMMLIPSHFEEGGEESVEGQYKDSNGEAAGAGMDEVAGTESGKEKPTEGVEATDMARQQAAAEAEKTATIQTDMVDEEGEAKPESNGVEQTKSEKQGDAAPENPTLDSLRRSLDPEGESENTSTSGKDPNAPSHAMTTRARARSPAPSDRASPSPSDSASAPGSINPWFLVPPTSLPDRDLGLPASEAEETRRILLLYVQKQENIVRQLTSMYTSLQKADRQRSEVFRACKAEAHLKDDGRGVGNMVTAMSDGEDWYDPEDWGLGERDLKVDRQGRLGLEKGKDEVEDPGDDGEGRRVGGRRRRVGRIG